MGGGASGKGGVADASLNVVPFIDLLVCLICFLLVSAAWTQLSRINVDQALPKASKTPPKDQDKKKDPKINIAVTNTAFLVNLWNMEEKPELGQPKRIAAKKDFKLCRGSGGLDDCSGEVETFTGYDRAGLKEYLITLLKTAGQGGKTKVMVAAADKVKYIALIGTLDTVLHACDPDDPKVCLQSPSVGDLNLLRAEGFVSFD